MPNKYVSIRSYSREELLDRIREKRFILFTEGEIRAEIERRDIINRLRYYEPQRYPELALDFHY